HDARDGHDVGDGERLGPARTGDRVEVPGQHVLAGAVDRRLRHAVGDVRVDAGDVLRDVAVELGAPGPGRGERGPLRLQIRPGVRGVAPHALFQRLVARRAAREGRQCAAPDVAQQIHEEQAVLRAGVTRAEHRALPRRTRDVRYAGRVVAHDGHVRARLDRA